MDDKAFKEMNQVKNDALDEALGLLRKEFETVQILCDDTLPPTEDYHRPRTLDYRRGDGNHNARVWLALKFVLRDLAENFLSIMKQSAERGDHKNRKTYED